MVFRPVVIAVVCVGIFLMFEALVPKAMALKTSNINEYGTEDQRSHKSRNYMLQRARDKKTLESLENVALNYEMDSARNPEDLSALIVDYANMIDDVILLDKSVETRTKKRGNIKVEKHNNQAIPDIPCNCKSKIEQLKFGDNVFPTSIDTKVCDREQENDCPSPYVCQEVYHDIPVLRRKTLRNAALSSEDIIPNNLSISWIAEYKPISIGCRCMREYEFTNDFNVKQNMAK